MERVSIMENISELGMVRANIIVNMKNTYELLMQNEKSSVSREYRYIKEVIYLYDEFGWYHEY